MQSDAEARPGVLIIGGFATAPPNYWPMRRRLRQRGAARVDICSLWPPDWALAGLIGLGPLARRAGRAIARTWRLSGRQPIIVVGHSGGGIVARLAMADQPFHGRPTAGVAEAVGCLVTLGTPHRLAALPNRYRHAGHAAAEFLDRATPGAYFAPRTGYLSVGSGFTSAGFPGMAGRAVSSVFDLVVGGDGLALTDGIVPVGAVALDGAEQLLFDDVRHGYIGGPWYGDERIIERWWPAALRLWHAALAARTPGSGVRA